MITDAKTTRRPAVIAVSASLAAGLALWLTRASFDVAGTAEAPVRVAMLPSVAELAGLIVLCLLISAAIGRVLGWVRGLDDVLMPAFGLAALALPYLPWLPDRLPVLRLLAGAGSALLWVVVLGHIGWLIAHRRAVTSGRLASVAGVICVFAVTFAAESYSLSRPGITPNLGSAAIAVDALIAASIWWWAVVLTRSKPAATFAWAAVFLSVPFVLNGGQLIPAVRDALVAIRHLPAATLTTLGSSAAGLLFDQEFGIFPYAPVLLVSIVGLWFMVRDPMRRLLAMALAAGVVTLIGLGGLVEPWWNESMMPGRRILPVLPMLAVPLASLYARAASAPLLRSALHSLLLVGLGVTIVIVSQTRVIPFPQEGDGSSSLLQWMSQTWDLWRSAPSFVGTHRSAALVQTALWLAAFGIGGWILSRKNALTDGQAALRATIVTVALAIAAASAGASLPIGGMSQRFNAEGRVIFPLLETFDPIARPLTIRYDPLSIVEPQNVVPAFALAAVPQQRLDRQPLRVVLNARFRLPAGEYVVDMKGSDLAGTVPDATVGLQIGREGRPLEVWPLSVAPGAHVQHRFRVPLDAEFVGFRASRQVEGTIAALRVTAQSVVPVRERFVTTTVRSAAAFGPVKVFFHDADAYPEPEGMWIKGRTTARMTVMKTDDSDGLVTATMHCGARPNVVTISSGDWSERFELVPGVHATVSVPTHSGQRFIPIAVTNSSGFVPAEVEGGGDRRLLGVWMAFTPGDIARTSASP